MKTANIFLAGVFLLLFFTVSCSGNTTVNDSDVIDGDIEIINDSHDNEIDETVDEDIVIEDGDIIDVEVDETPDDDSFDDDLSDDLPEADLDDDFVDEIPDDDFP